MFLAERGLRRPGGGRLPLGPPPRVFVTSDDLIKLAHPRADDRLLGKAVDLRQTADSALDVVAEDFAEVGGGQSAALDHGHDALAAQEYVEIAVYGAVERLVCWDRQLAVQKRLYTYNAIQYNTIFFQPFDDQLPYGYSIDKTSRGRAG